MPNARVELLLRQLDITWALFEYHLPGIDDDACLWEPAATCWTVRPDGEGGWVADFAEVEPDPVPALSIGWLTWHIGYWWTHTAEHCFGSGAPGDIHWPGSAAATASWLGDLKDRWVADLRSVPDADLDSSTRTAGLPWGEGQTLADVAGWVNVELTKNVAEIGLVRNLYELQRPVA